MSPISFNPAHPCWIAFTLVYQKHRALVTSSSERSISSDFTPAYHPHTSPVQLPTIPSSDVYFLSLLSQLILLPLWLIRNPCFFVMFFFFLSPQVKFSHSMCTVARYRGEGTPPSQTGHVTTSDKGLAATYTYTGI